MKKQWVWLTLIVLCSFSARLYFALQTPEYSSSESYLHLRLIETIKEGHLTWQDQLTDRTIIISPLFDLLIAILSFITPFAYKILPALFASLIAIPAYLTAKKLTNDHKSSILSAILASIIPAYFSNTFNQISTISLAIPLYFFTLYAWMQSNKQKWSYNYLGLLLLLSMMTPLSTVLIISIGIYFLLSSIENLKTKTEEYELGLFSIFFNLWVQFILYKKAILFHGPNIIWQNLPKQILNTFYTDVTIIGAIASIGLFPLADGIHSLYKTTFKQPTKETLLILSTAITTAAALWFKLIAVQTGFMLLGITLSIAFAHGFIILINYISETKLAKYVPIISITIITAAIITTAIPAYASTQAKLTNTITSEEIKALQELQQTPTNSIIIAPPEYGHYITYNGKRATLLDSYFLLQKRTNEKYEDINRIYKTPFETEAVELFDKYKADYLVVPPETKDITYGDQKCFKRIHATNIKIYEKNPECQIKTIN